MELTHHCFRQDNGDGGVLLYFDGQGSNDDKAGGLISRLMFRHTVICYWLLKYPLVSSLDNTKDFVLHDISEDTFNLVRLIEVVSIAVWPIQVILKQLLLRHICSGDLQSRLFQRQSLGELFCKLHFHGVAIPWGEMNCSFVSLAVCSMQGWTYSSRASPWGL